MIKYYKRITIFIWGTATWSRWPWMFNLPRGRNFGHR